MILVNNGEFWNDYYSISGEVLKWLEKISLLVLEP